MNRDYFDRRVWLRGLFAALLTASALLICVPFEAAMGNKNFRPIQFLFEPVRRPTTIAASSFAANYVFQAILPATGAPSAMLAPGDLLASGVGRDASTAFLVEKVDPIYSNTRHNVPVATSLVMLFDQSGSLHDQQANGVTYPGTDNSGARFKAAQAFIDALPTAIRAAIVSFSGADVVADPNPDPIRVRSGFTSDRAQLHGAVEELQHITPDGQTPLFSSIKACLEMLVNEHNAEKHIITFTDGDPTNDTASESEVRDLAAGEHVRLDFIALGNESQWTDITDLANATGGKLVKAESASALRAGFAQMASRLRNTIAYRVTIRAGRATAFHPGEHLNVQLRPNSSQAAGMAPKQYAILVGSTRK